MNTNVKPGDRATVVPPALNENLGIICEVVEAYAGQAVECRGMCLFYGRTEEPAWVVESLGRDFTAENNAGLRRSVAVHVLDDRCLRRLPRPDEMPEEDSLPVELKETA